MYCIHSPLIPQWNKEGNIYFLISSPGPGLINHYHYTPYSCFALIIIVIVYIIFQVLLWFPLLQFLCLPVFLHVSPISSSLKLQYYSCSFIYHRIFSHYIKENHFVSKFWSLKKWEIYVMWFFPSECDHFGRTIGKYSFKLFRVLAFTLEPIITLS